MELNPIYSCSYWISIVFHNKSSQPCFHSDTQQSSLTVNMSCSMTIIQLSARMICFASAYWNVSGWKNTKTIYQTNGPIWVPMKKRCSLQAYVNTHIQRLNIWGVFAQRPAMAQDTSAFSQQSYSYHIYTTQNYPHTPKLIVKSK